MIKYCIETINLTHTFSGEERVLDSINLRVPEGAIYGFLGPNGAGKTTTLRLLLGLLKKQEGSIAVFGKPFEKNRVAILKKTGSLIETPSIYGHLTAIENLNVLRKIYNCPKERIQAVLSLVGLPGTGNKKASQFSLGMKQRLSIATAMLNNPSLLILDEPTNGLDPNGIIEMRELLKKLNRELGITLLISSHLLSEIQKLVTHAGIINKGNILFQGTLDELINKQQQASCVVFGTSDTLNAVQIISRYGLVPRIENEKILLPVIPKEKIANIARHLMENSIDVYEISSTKSDLEAIFIDLVNP